MTLRLVPPEPRPLWGIRSAPLLYTVCVYTEREREGGERERERQSAIES